MAIVLSLWWRTMCRILNPLLYPFCMLTIQLPSDMLTGPPPTILVLLWTKQPTEESSPRKAETHPHICYVVSYVVLYTFYIKHKYTFIDTGILPVMVIYCLLVVFTVAVRALPNDPQ